jgi:hypothetical protein
MAKNALDYGQPKLCMITRPGRSWYLWTGFHILKPLPSKLIFAGHGSINANLVSPKFPKFVGTRLSRGSRECNHTSSNHTSMDTELLIGLLSKELIGLRSKERIIFQIS